MSKWKSKLEDDDKPHDGKCMAYGCPLPGSMSHTTIGKTNDWVCRYHFFADALQWPEITRKLRVESLALEEEVNF